VRSMFMEADRNGDGVIDYDEWMHLQKLQKMRRSGSRRATSRRRATSHNAGELPPPSQLPSPTSADIPSQRSFQVASACSASAAFHERTTSVEGGDEPQPEQPGECESAPSTAPARATSGAVMPAVVTTRAALRDLLSDLCQPGAANVRPPRSPQPSASELDQPRAAPARPTTHAAPARFPRLFLVVSLSLAAGPRC
jgi:hypothetical protein